MSHKSISNSLRTQCELNYTVLLILMIFYYLISIMYAYGLYVYVIIFKKNETCNPLLKYIKNIQTFLDIKDLSVINDFQMFTFPVTMRLDCIFFMPYL